MVDSMDCLLIMCFEKRFEANLMNKIEATLILFFERSGRSGKFGRSRRSRWSRRLGSSIVPRRSKESVRSRSGMDDYQLKSSLFS